MESDRIFQFGNFSLDPRRLELRRDGRVVPLKPRHFDALLFFVKSGGRFLSKEELIEALWPNTVVEENNLAQCVSVLRKALENGEGNQRFIETVPGRGYRFVAAVREVSREEADRKVLVSSTPARSSRHWFMAGAIPLVLIAAHWALCSGAGRTRRRLLPVFPRLPLCRSWRSNRAMHRPRSA